MDSNLWSMKNEWGETSDCSSLLPGECFLVMEQRGKTRYSPAESLNGRDRTGYLGTLRLLEFIRQNTEKSHIEQELHRIVQSPPPSSREYFSGHTQDCRNKSPTGLEGTVPTQSQNVFVPKNWSEKLCKYIKLREYQEGSCLSSRK